jgi:hypothetical protein
MGDLHDRRGLPRDDDRQRCDSIGP